MDKATTKPLNFTSRVWFVTTSVLIKVRESECIRRGIKSKMRIRVLVKRKYVGVEASIKCSPGHGGDQNQSLP